MRRQATPLGDYVPHSRIPITQRAWTGAEEPYVGVASAYSLDDCAALIRASRHRNEILETLGIDDVEIDHKDLKAALSKMTNDPVLIPAAALKKERWTTDQVFPVSLWATAGSGYVKIVGFYGES